MGDSKAKAVALNSVLAPVCPSKSGCLAFTRPSARVDGAVGIIAPKVGGLALVLHDHDERAPFSGVSICQAPRKSSSLLCAWALRPSKLEIVRPQKSADKDRKNRVHLCVENIFILSAYFSQSQQARINRGAFVLRLSGPFVLAGGASFIKTVGSGNSTAVFTNVLRPL